MIKRQFLAALSAAALSLLAACGQDKPAFKGVDITGADYAKGWELSDQHGQVRTLKDFAGKVVVVFFGYTQCPDVCPTSMQELAQVKQLLGPDGDKLQGVFITIDPERDTPARMAEYARAFPGLTALTGTPAQIAETAKAYAVFYSKQSPRPDGCYDMEHTRAAYLFDRGGKPIALLPTDKSAPEVAKELAKWVR